MNTKQKKPVVLISAVNINEGGPLSILTDAVNTFMSGCISNYNLVLLVYDKQLFKQIDDNPGVEIYEYKYSKKSWLLRAWFEYVHSWFISKKIRSDVWISLNDITPNVITKTKIVYCQNPAPFYKLARKQFTNEKTLFFFHFFYSFFYRINIRSNKYVIVQQQWLREEFVRRFKLNNIIVAHPDVFIPHTSGKQKKLPENFLFFYPALPRSFKNFEVLIEAAASLYTRKKNFEVIMTFDGSENKYAAKLVTANKTKPYLKFIGLQSRDSIWQQYDMCSCLVFPSLMETWGLPISEAKLYNKPMLVAKLKYAYETVGSYDKACFFDAENSVELADIMEKAVDSTLQYTVVKYRKEDPPFVQSWQELYNLILSDKVPQSKDPTLHTVTLYDAQ